MFGNKKAACRIVLLPVIVVMAACDLAGLAAEPAKGPQDQFQSVVYVRKNGATAQMYKRLRPDTLVMIYPRDFYDWGGKFMYTWFFPHLIGYKEEASADSTDLKAWAADPNAYIETFGRGMWTHWEKYRAAGILTGERPARFEDLVCVSEEYATAARDGKPLPRRLRVIYKDRQLGPLCIANPDAARIMADITKFNAAHFFDARNKKDRHMPVNGGFIDLDGLQGCPMDFSEFSRAKFDAWVRANYAAEQIKAIFQADPAGPIPILTPKGANAQLAQIYDRMRTEFYYNHLYPQYCRAVKAAIDSVLGPGQFHFIYHGDGYWWRILHGYPTNMVCWGDWLDSYCVECGVTPYLQGGRCYYAAPNFIEYRVSDVNANWHNSNNVYDYQYGAGRLWGEPVVVKTGYKGPPLGRSEAVVQLGLAEGLALLGNMRIDAASEKSSAGKGSVPGSLALPMVEFMHAIAPRVRQMIPAARVGVVFSPADSWTFKGFDKPSNDTQACQVSNILHCQHVPLQVAHLGILEQTLAQRPMDVLIVPWLRCLKDSQAAVLERFVRDGGKAVFVGDCGTLSWEGLRREKNALAEMLPEAQAGKVTFKQVGKGRTALIPGALDEKIESAEKLQAALFEVLGQTPSRVRPDRWPLLLVNLTRNSDNSRFWAHLVNYDVEYAKTDAQKPVHPIENVRVVVPLPEGLTAKSVKLYRPGSGEVELKAQPGREGCAVTVPEVDIYALVAVETEPGARPEEGVATPATAAEAARMVAKGFDPSPTDKKLVAPPGPLPAEKKAGARRFTDHLLIAYVTSAGDRPVGIKYKAEDAERRPDMTIYTAEGKRVVPTAGAENGETILTLPGLGAANHYCLIIKAGAKHCSFAFTHEGGGCFEASQFAPLTLDEEGDSAPLYFYVPKGCKSFRLYPNTRPFWTPRLGPVHLVIKDAEGKPRLDSTGPVDGGWTWETGEKKDKVFEIPVPNDQAGRVWSLWLLDARGEKEKKGFVQFWLEGVPPMVAPSPGQLLIAKGDE